LSLLFVLFSWTSLTVRIRERAISFYGTKDNVSVLVLFFPGYEPCESSSSSSDSDSSDSDTDTDSDSDTSSESSSEESGTLFGSFGWHFFFCFALFSRFLPTRIDF
jgi:hypothetical protein